MTEKKYYKILSENEIHNNLQYHTGLNIDPLPFDPTGDCQSGGIYFSDVENIFSFLNYGPWIREVKIPENAKVYENPGEPRKWKADRVQLGARRRWGSLTTFKRLVKEGADIYVDNGWVLHRATLNGYLEIIKFLVSRGADIHTQCDSALYFAAKNGHLEVVKFLVSQGADIHALNNEALHWAAWNGYLEIVKFLVSQGANIQALNEWDLRHTAQKGHLEVVKFFENYKTKR